MIRLAEQTDIEEIDRFDPFAGDRSQETHEGRLFVWVADSHVVGYVTIAGFLLHRCPYIEFLCVRAEYRRQGIASALLSKIEDDLRGRRILISTEENNLAMLSLLRARSYQYAGSLSGLNRDGLAENFYYKDLLA